MKYYKYFKTSYLNKLQYFLSLIILALLLVSLIPEFYNKISFYIITIIVIQFIISLIRYRFINSIFEFLIFFLSIIGLIPYIGWLFRLIALPIALLDLFASKDSAVFQTFEIYTKNKAYEKNPFKKKTKFKIRDNKKSKSKKKDQEKVYDAEFREK
jgi:predicted membrane protein